MKLYKAQVISNYDYTETGIIQVSSTSFAGNKFVRYTSPYGGHHNPITGDKSGFFAIPAKGSLVLVAQTEDEDDFYLISIIHQSDKRKTTNTIKQIKNKKPVDESLYTLFPGKPQQLKFSDHKGNALILSHGSSPKMNRENIKAELRSGLGKRLSLIDTPIINRIILETEEKDGVYITSRQSDVPTDLGSRHLLLRTGGMIQGLAQHGIDLTVIDGLEFDISNESAGVYAAPGVNFGNINITSKHKDINITTDGIAGKVMIRSKGSNGLVQINADGSIIIKAPNDNIYVESGGDLNLYAENNLNIEARNNVNIKAGSRAVMSGSSATVSLETDAVLDGTFVHLAPAGGVSPATGAEGATNITNDYGD
jgi:hypothetical protein